MFRVRFLACACVVVGALSASCSPPARGPLPDAGALADTLKGLIADAYDFSKPGMVDRMLGLYESGSGFASATGGQLTVSRDSLQSGITRFWEMVGKNMKDPVWKWENVEVLPLGADAATLTGTWTIPHIAPNGQPHVLSGAWTAVFRRTSSGWKIVQEHLSGR
jgi:hypothetical protein